MSHQQLPSIGTISGSSASGALRLVWRHRNNKALVQQGESEALLAGQVHTQVAEAGKIYRVVNAQDQIVTPEKAQRQGNHLVIVLKGNVQIVIQDFFAYTGKKAPQDNDEDFFKQTDAQAEVQAQGSLFATDFAEDVAPVWQYAEGLSLSSQDSLLVQSGSTPDSVLGGGGIAQDIQLAQAQTSASDATLAAGGTNPAMLAFLGAVGIQAIANAGSTTPNNALNLQVLLGKVKAGNDLKVLVYKVVNGQVEKNFTEVTAKIDEDSRVQVEMGSYTGLVKIVVKDGGSEPDFYDDLTLSARDAQDGVDLVTSYVNVGPGVMKANVNHVTNLVAKKLDSLLVANTPLSETAVKDAYKAVATSLGLPSSANLQSDEVKIPGKDAGSNAYGVLNAVLSQVRDITPIANKIAQGTFVAATELKDSLLEFAKSTAGRVNKSLYDVADNLKVSRVDVDNVDRFAPVFKEGAAATVSESLVVGSYVYTVEASDAQTVTYELTNPTFVIDSSTGKITTKAPLDFETTSTYPLTVVARDASNNSSSQTITINVSDAFEAPKLRVGTNDAKVFVKGQNGELDLAQFFVDEDAHSALTYRIVEGSLPAGISFANGVIRGIATGVEAARNIKVVANDGKFDSPSKTISISSVDKPTISSVTITDTMGATKVGKPGDVVTIEMMIGEAVNLNPNGSLTGTTFSFKESAGGAAVSFTPTSVTLDAAKTKITLVGTFQAGKNSENLVFDALTLPPNTTLTGAQSGQLMLLTGYSVLSGYKLDSQAATPSLMLASDTGMSSSDGISSLGLVTVAGIEANATWEYSTNNGVSWTAGTGGNFSLAMGSYAANAVQVRQTDHAGNSSEIGKIAGSLMVDSSAPTLTSAQFDGNFVVLTFSEPVDSSSLAATAVRFGFKDRAGAVISPSTYGVSAVAAGAGTNQVKLSLANDAQKTALASALSANTEISLTYADPAGNDATAVLQDLAGNDLASILTGERITYRPVVVAATITDNLEPFSRGKGGNPVTITLTLSENVTLEQGQSLTSVTLTFKDRVNGTAVNLSPASANLGAASSKTLTFVGTLPATGDSDNLVLTNVTINSANNAPVLRGQSGQVMQSQDYAIMTGYALDNTTPSAPMAVLATDTGNATDGISSVGVVRVSNLASDLKTWEYNPGTGWLTGSGSAFTLAAGTYAANLVKLRQTDTVGQTSGETSLGAITIAPPAPITAALASDTGSSATDGVTRIATLSVTGLEAGATWSFSTNGGSNWSPVSSGTSTQLPVGSYAAGSIKVRQIDSANMPSADTSLSGAVTVDTTAPTLSSPSASANANKLTLTFSESLSNMANFVPTASDFTVTGKSISAVSVSGNQVVLTVSPAYTYDPGKAGGTIAYTNGADATDLQDLAGNEVMTFSGITFTNDTPDRPAISGGALKGVTNLDVRSDLVLSLNSSDLNLVAGKKIKIVNDNNTRGSSLKGYADGDSKFNDIEITISSNGADVLGTTKVLSQEQDTSAGKNKAPNRQAIVTETTPTALNQGIQTNNSIIKIVGNKLIINPCIDLDFTNGYHIEVEEGALIDSNQLTNAALVNPAETAFRTVLPAANTKINDQENREGTLSIKMSDAGALVNSYYWLDLEGRGDQTSLEQFQSDETHIYDAAAKKYAFAFADKTSAQGLQGSGFQVRIFNFGKDDLIYADSLGVPGEVVPSFKNTTWNYNFDYVGVDAGAAVYEGFETNSQNPHPAPPPANPTLPKRVFSNFAAGGLRILLSADPADLALLDPNNPSMNTLEKVQASSTARFQNALDFQSKLNGSDLSASLTTSLLAIDPNNMKLHLVLG